MAVYFFGIDYITTNSFVQLPVIKEEIQRVPFHPEEIK
ncbi:hypothetical protein COLO4_23965 [Corchorus olitorius]|uniref:Uncharacterized protein n=1 Tax=Corchorus olitorius TaxID=93759 RepID=A0A1R3IDR9_9ROSI|nr:hypothetical protein COLO4_23965 [Corchorus olitorius]